VKVDHVLPARAIGGAITDLVMNGHRRVSRNGRRKSSRKNKSRTPKTETPNAEEPNSDGLETGALSGPPSPFTCPDCGGTLWEFRNGDLIRYRCHVGHGFTEESLALNQNDTVEDALWSALRAIEESIELRKRMTDRARMRNLTAVIPSLERDITEYESRADVLRALVLRPGGNGKKNGRRPARQRHSSNGSRKRR
jgi:hypothetical protein